MLTIAYLPISDNVRAVTHDDYEIDVGALTWFDLEDFDEIGDKLTLTVLFKRNPDGTFQERPIDLMIIRTSRLRGTPSIEGLVDLAMYHEQNINRSIRDKVYENKEGSQMSLLFFNDRLPGETGDEKNTTIRIKIDYVVNNVNEEESMNLTSIIVIILVVVAVIGLLALGVFLFKRKIKERYSFFNTSHS
ncbi:MAG: hypothetical protein U9R75_07220, partial [Candidatus Thermoplasmatota archaeon]|nr:hypothetical protein [Candidatus Thermoplasmatota archaeon]